MKPEEFVARLQESAKDEGTIFGRLALLEGSEDQYRRETTRFAGYVSLSKASKCFFLETIECMNKGAATIRGLKLSDYYSLFVVKVTQNFQQICGAEKAAHFGYPYVGYTELRNTYDNLLLISAALLGIVDYYATEGLEKGVDFEPVAARKLRKAAELTARKSMVGANSALSESTIKELKEWDDLFDYETHGSRISLAMARDYLQGKAKLQVLPSFDERHFMLFMNRHSEIGWMLHRLLPLMQPRDFALPAEWRAKWEVLDDSYKQIVDLPGKAIGAAMIEYVTKKLPYNAESTFPI